MPAVTPFPKRQGPAPRPESREDFDLLMDLQRKLIDMGKALDNRLERLEQRQEGMAIVVDKLHTLLAKIYRALPVIAKWGDDKEFRQDQKSFQDRIRAG